MTPKQQLQALGQALTGLDRILILPHNDPDPDAVAGAVALRYLLRETRQIDCRIAYDGIIGRAENKALVSYLGDPLEPLAALTALDDWPLALVDAQPGSGNNPIPAGVRVVVVIDHHPRRETTAAAFADIRPEVGAASVMLTEYLQAAGLEPPPPLATALFYGIKTDTMGLSRSTNPADAAAYFYLQPRIDARALIEIEYAQVPLSYFKNFAAALQAARIYDQVVVSYVGAMAYPDMAAEIADLMLRLEGIEWVICLGVYQNKLVLAIRTRSPEGRAGLLARTIVGDQGSAGGHGLMAGGQIPLAGRDPKGLAGRLTQRILRHLDLPPEARGEMLIKKI
jgi:nanoRNase/pAp phosphatase (c-di-AMP/oligoRNAs hydrolase)